MAVELGQTLLYHFYFTVLLCAFEDCCLCAVADYLHFGLCFYASLLFYYIKASKI